MATEKFCAREIRDRPSGERHRRRRDHGFVGRHAMSTWIQFGRTIRLVFSAISLAVISACAGATHTDLFSTDWSDDQGRSILTVQSKLRGTHPPPGANIAIGVAGHGNLIIAQPLGEGARWTFAHTLDARPLV